MRIVVTGALGHIGSRLIREIPEMFENAEIVLVDNLSTQRFCSLFDLPGDGGYRFLEADILTADLESVFEGAEVVVHLAAVTNAADSFAIQDQVEEVNFQGTQKVAQACARCGSTLLFPSTTSVYGPQSGTVEEDCPEGDLRPQSPYAESKLRAERFLQSLGARGGMRFIICRFGTIFGPSIGMRFHTAVNKFCWQAVNGLPLTVWRTAMDQRRPYLDLKDAVRAMKFIVANGLFDGYVYNIVTTNASVRDIVEAISAFVPEVRVDFVDSPIMNQLSYSVLNERFKRLGFEFEGCLNQGIAETIRLFGGLHR